jgi:hypothetical protein
MSARVLATMGNKSFIRAFASRPDQFWLTVLAPSSQTRAKEILEVCNIVLQSLPGNPAWLALRGAARYRAGELEPARQDLRESIASYGRSLSEAAARMPMLGKSAVVASAAEVAPGCTEGTPREWIILAMVEKRVGKVDEARGWLAQASNWIEMATHDPPDPAAFGGLSDPGTRVLLRVSAGNNVALKMHTVAEHFLGSWRQLLALKVLEREARDLIFGSDLPSDVFAPE